MQPLAPVGLVQGFEGHRSVLLEESIASLCVRSDGWYLDATCGGGGHASAILSRLGPDGKLFACDRDPQALECSASLAKDPRCILRQVSFSDLGAFASRYQLAGRLQGVLADLGVSSLQLEDPQRGFSFMKEGPLDMRMNPTAGDTAAEWLGRATEKEIARVLREYGEQPGARRIAAAIVRDRKRESLVSTGQLVRLVTGMSSGRGHRHPATRIFQAIRMYINSEIAELRSLLHLSLNLLERGGHLAVISFHSLESREVRSFMRQNAGYMDTPPGFPIHMTEQVPARLRIVKTAVRPGAAECEQNPRARSAILRVAARI